MHLKAAYSKVLVNKDCIRLCEPVNLLLYYKKKDVRRDSSFNTPPSELFQVILHTTSSFTLYVTIVRLCHHNNNKRAGCARQRKERALSVQYKKAACR